MAIIHTSAQDRNDRCDTSHPLVVLRCGINSTIRHAADLRDDLRIERPNGRRDYQLMYVCAGQALHLFSDGWTTVSTGDVILYRPGEPQFYTYQANVPALCKWVHFSGAKVEELLEQCGLGTGCLLHPGENDQLSSLYDQLMREQQLPGANTELVSAALLTQLLVKLGRILQQPANTPPQKLQKKMEAVIRHLHDHYGESLTVEDCASLCGMDSFAFLRSFKAHTGQTPHAYLTNLRLTNAKHLLRSSQLPVQDVALLCGYEDPLYFSRLFTKKEGCSPSNYRIGV